MPSRQNNMGKYFGTDGVRGVANVELTPQLAYNIGRAGAYVLKKRSLTEGEKPRIIIGTDTRISKDLLFCALASGIMSIGIDVINVGVAPTPAVAYLVKECKATAGAVISASHNPMEYNGIKFFNAQGFKLDDDLEFEIEEIIDNMESIDQEVSADRLGRLVEEDSYIERYKRFLISAFETDLSGLKITLDCANGAAYSIAPEVFEKLGAEVAVIHASPDGCNINKDAGSTHIEGLCEAVKKNSSDVGLAYDGDADRLIAVDEKGNPVDGDQIMLICANELKKAGRLKKNKLAVTVMSNLGLHVAGEKMGIGAEVTAVGDRYVLERMLEQELSLGGEQSGHMIFLDYTTTGDGILSSLFLASILKKSGQKLSELAKIMEIYPQVLVNAKVANPKKEQYKFHPEIQSEIKRLEEIMAGKGRVLIRHSGTEPLIRVMLEGENSEEITAYAKELANLIEKTLA